MPECSSDLWTGVKSTSSTGRLRDGYVFAGRKIAEAVLEDLASGDLVYDGVPGPLRSADTVVIAGGAGVIAYAEELTAKLPPSASALSVCDGCIIPDVAPFVNRSCGRGPDCPPSTSLPLAVSQWGLTPPQWCGATTAPDLCLVSSKLVASRGRRLLALQAGLDKAGLELNGWFCTSLRSAACTAKRPSRPPRVRQVTRG